MPAAFGRFGARNCLAGFLTTGNLLPLVPSPVEAAADDALDDPVIGGRGWSDAYAEIDLPFRGHVEVDRREELLLLVMQAGDVCDTAVIGVVLKPAADLPGEVLT